MYAQNVTNQVPPLEEKVNDDQAPVDPPPLTEGAISDNLFQMTQAITTQAQVITTQSQSRTAQTNREVVPQANQQVSTMASLLRDFTRTKSPIFYGSVIEEEPQELIDEIYKILYSMELTTSEKADSATYQFKDVVQPWYVQWRDYRPLRG